MEIRDQDLIGKEFPKHEKCYRDYTRILYKNESSEEPLYTGVITKAYVELLRKM